MKFIVCSRFSADTIASAIGQPEYSYYFVLKEFLPLLKEMGAVAVVSSPAEADLVYRESMEKGEEAYFLHFTAPHNRAKGIAAPVIPVFAWEYDTIPDESWDGDGYNNWTLSLKACGAAITHSLHTVKAIKQALGEDFPVVSLPAPIWDRCEEVRQRVAGRPGIADEETVLKFFGVLCDSRHVVFENIPDTELLPSRLASISSANSNETEAVTRHSLRFRLGTAKYLLVQLYRQCIADLLPDIIRRGIGRGLGMIRPAYRALLPKANDVTGDEQAGNGESDSDRDNIVEISGVIYTSLFNPYDGRKNWETMLTAFCWAFKDVEDATLLVKISSNQIVQFADDAIAYLRRLRPFKCRVVIIKGFLERDQYESFVEATSYYVNTSSGEGQCLPLMEFLSSGVPAVAPINSAMADYMAEDVGFVIDSRPELAAWQHDERRMYRTFQQRADWMSTVEAFQSSYRMIKERPDQYASMSQRAIEKMKGHCSIAVLKERLHQFLANQIASREQLAPSPDLPAEKDPGFGPERAEA